MAITINSTRRYRDISLHFAFSAVMVSPPRQKRIFSWVSMERQRAPRVL